MRFPCPYVRSVGAFGPPQEQSLIDGVEDAYYVDREIIEQQLQTKTYEMSREEAKMCVRLESVNNYVLNNIV